MKVIPIGIIMNGVTGRMGANQHLARSIAAIRGQGGLPVGVDILIVPEPILVGRNENKLKRLAQSNGDVPWSTDLASCLSDEKYGVYFDAQTTDRRVEAVKQALAAGKHVYCEKPTATDAAGAMELARLAEAAKLKNGVVQDKLWLPGLRKLQQLIDMGFFGEILSVRGEFGYWVYPGEHVPAQRPSWNYRAAEGGGIILDMLCHWRYVIDNLFGNVTGVSCLGAVHVGKRWDEAGKPYDADAEDAAYATFTTDRGIVCHFNSSWQVRVRRDDLFTMQVDGTKGSAVAGLRDCRVQPGATTPMPVWNPDIPAAIDYFDNWTLVPNRLEFPNAFRAQWELFLRHVALDEPFRWSLREGAKGVQLAGLGYESWKKRCWLDVPNL